MKLGLLANGVPLRMVNILLATLGISAGDLQVPVRVGTDPDLAPGWWDGQLANAPYLRAVHLFPVGGDISKAGSTAFSLDTRPLVGSVPQPAAMLGYLLVGHCEQRQ